MPSDPKDRVSRWEKVKVPLVETWLTRSPNRTGIICWLLDKSSWSAEVVLLYTP